MWFNLSAAILCPAVWIMNKAKRCGKTVEYVLSQPVYAFHLPQNEPKNEVLKFKAKECFCMARTTKWCMQICTVSSIIRPVCIFRLVAFVWNAGTIKVPGMLLAIVNWWSYQPRDAQFVICCDSVDRDPDRTDRPSAWCASKSARWWYYACPAVMPYFRAYSV